MVERRGVLGCRQHRGGTGVGRGSSPPDGRRPQPPRVLLAIAGMIVGYVVANEVVKAVRRARPAVSAG
ncbi:MAG: hypothetical protein ACKOE2_04395 [Actinomycetales bacterium]